VSGETEAINEIAKATKELATTASNSVEGERGQRVGALFCTILVHTHPNEGALSCLARGGFARVRYPHRRSVDRPKTVVDRVTERMPQGRYSAGRLAAEFAIAWLPGSEAAHRGLVETQPDAEQWVMRVLVCRPARRLATQVFALRSSRHSA